MANNPTKLRFNSSWAVQISGIFVLAIGAGGFLYFQSTTLHITFSIGAMILLCLGIAMTLYKDITIISVKESAVINKLGLVFLYRKKTIPFDQIKSFITKEEFIVGRTSKSTNNVAVSHPSKTIYKVLLRKKNGEEEFITQFESNYKKDAHELCRELTSIKDKAL